MVIRTTDAFVTAGKLGEMFDIPPENVRILPQDFHVIYEKAAKYSPTGSCDIVCDGSFSSFANGIIGAKAVVNSIHSARYAIIAGLIFGCIGVLSASVLGSAIMLSPTLIVGWNLAFLMLANLLGKPKNE
jgi:Cu+-exporting ATPase